MIHDYNHAIHASPDGLWTNRLRSATKSEKHRCNKELGVNDLKSPLFTPKKGFMETNFETYATPSTNEKIGYKTLLEYNTPSPLHDSRNRQFREVKRNVDRAEIQSLLKMAPVFDQVTDDKQEARNSPNGCTKYSDNPNLIHQNYLPPHTPKYHSTNSRTTNATNATSNLPTMNPNYNYNVSEGSISPRRLNFNRTEPSSKDALGNYVTPQKIIFYNLKSESVNNTYGRNSSAKNQNLRHRAPTFALNPAEESFQNENIIFNTEKGPRIFTVHSEDKPIEEIHYDRENKNKILLLNNILNKDYNGKLPKSSNFVATSVDEFETESTQHQNMRKNSGKVANLVSNVNFDLGEDLLPPKSSLDESEDLAGSKFGLSVKEKPPSKSCTTCNCKNSKCLKLYCECFR